MFVNFNLPEILRIFPFYSLRFEYDQYAAGSLRKLSMEIKDLSETYERAIYSQYDAMFDFFLQLSHC